MQAFVEKMSLEQKIWYARLLTRTILADGVIVPVEVKYIKDVIGLIDDKQSRDSLIKLVNSKQGPPLQQPKGFNKEALALVFSQLIKICISDMVFVAQEKELLMNVSYLFDFTPEYTQRLLEWGEEGLNVKQKQQLLTSKRINDQELLVPIKKFQMEQKLWYIDAIVTAMLIEDVDDKKRIEFLKSMLASTDNDAEKQIIKKHVIQRNRPPLRRPPRIPNEVLTLIFIELITILTAKGDLSYQGQEQIKTLTDICKLPTKSYTDLIDWCRRGIAWKKTKKKLIAEVEVNLSEKDRTDLKKGLLKTHSKNNSLLTRKVRCFVCNSSETFPKLQLKPYSHKTLTNVFGVPKYLKANEGFDFIDFSLCSISVCPTCFFASNEEHLFAKDEKDSTPDELCDTYFKEKWRKNTEKRNVFTDKEFQEFQSIHRTHETVVKAYGLAIHSAEQGADFTMVEIQKHRSQMLRLQLAEIFMAKDLVDLAEEELKAIQKISEWMLEKGTVESYIYASAKILLLLSLYHEDEEATEKYLDFFETYKKANLPSLKAALRAEFQKTADEVTNIANSCGSYTKNALNGFHLATIL